MRRRAARELIAVSVNEAIVLPKIKACAITWHVQTAGLLNRRLMLRGGSFLAQWR